MNELTTTQRAHLALGAADHEAALVALSAKHKAITAITNQDGFRDCHSARMECKGARVEIEKRAKLAREDANAFSKAVIAEAGRLVGLIQPEEDRLGTLQCEWLEKLEREKEAKAQAERLRVQDLRDRLRGISLLPLGLVGKSSGDIADAAQKLSDIAIGEDFAEFELQAVDAKSGALITLREMWSSALAREVQAEQDRAAAEVEAQRLVAERADLDRQRAEQAIRDRAEREQLAKDRAQLQAEQAKARAEQAEAVAKEATERAARDAQQRRADAERTAKRDAEEAAEKARFAEEWRLKDQLAALQAEVARIELESISAQRAALIRQQADANRAAIAREIDTATLIDAATEAHVLLVTLNPDHIATRKLGAALERERADKDWTQSGRA